MLDEQVAEIEFKAPTNRVFIIRDATFTATSGVPIFRGTVDDRSGSDWDDVHVAVTVALKCPGGASKNAEFMAAFGNLRIGENKVSEAVVSARGVLDSGCEPNGFTAKFMGGTPISEARSKERQRERAEAEATSQRHLRPHKRGATRSVANAKLVTKSSSAPLKRKFQT
ncbi:MAG TPA: hypothetical protein VKB79_15360 [Bryobacteraceae bacterium]|nr:hypothetical protein [Bryobacteraceae bacterium]